MNIWKEYLNLYSHENPLVVIGTITASIAVLTFIITFILRPIVNWIKKYFAKISVEIGISHQIAQSVIGVGMLAPLFTVTVTNRDRITRHIQNPSIKPSRKINGEKYFVVPKPKGTYPLRLEPGEQHTVEYDTISMQNQLLVHLKESDKIRVKVSDTTGKKYLSNRMKVSNILGHIEAANNQAR
jgi:hypothetical protein